jgi:hypothetical protein
MERHVIIFAPKYVIITKHVGLTDFQPYVSTKVGLFRTKKKERFPRERGFPNKKRGECMDFCVDYAEATGPERTRTGPKRTRKKHS